MSTEFYCEEFPTEQNGKPVQTLKDLLEACPEDGFHFMTPVGYVDLTAQDAGQLRQGAAMPAHAGESGWEIPIPAEKLLEDYTDELAAQHHIAGCGVEALWTLYRQITEE